MWFIHVCAYHKEAESIGQIFNQSIYILAPSMSASVLSLSNIWLVAIL